MMNELKIKLGVLLQQYKSAWVSDIKLESYTKMIGNLEKIVYPETIEKQHIVPQTFLEWFADNWSALYCYDLNKQSFLGTEMIPVENLLKENNFYVFEDQDRKSNFFFEKFVFSMYLEGWIKELIQKLDTHKSLSEEDWQLLSWFIVYQFARTKSFIQNIQTSHGEVCKIQFQNSFRTYEDFLATLTKNTIDNEGVDPKELYEYIQSWKYDVRVDKDSALVLAMQMANDLWHLFLNAHYEILEVEEDWFFLCSDTPFFIIPPKWWSKYIGVWLMYPKHAEKIIPINKRQCLQITLLPEYFDYWVSCSYTLVDQDEIDRINEYIVKNANRFVLSKDKDYLQDILWRINFLDLEVEKKRKRVNLNENWRIVGNYFYPH